jgi:transcriptional regulator with XRE-family HTH domain
MTKDCDTSERLWLIYANMQINLHIRIMPGSSKTVASLIRREVKRRGITQTELASLAQIHQSQISRILRGEFRRSSINLKKVCKCLAITEPSKARPSHATARLTQAVSDVWDGSKNGEKALVRLLSALREMIE